MARREQHDLRARRGLRPDAVELSREARPGRPEVEAGERVKGLPQVRRLCGGEDGPSELYLGLIAGYETDPPTDEWDGVIRLTTK